jgi:acyl-coenzyme A thioesterase PaaI-like protein
LATRHGPHHRSFWDIPEHPDDPAWIARRRLAAAIRRLNDLAVVTDGPAGDLDAIAAALESAGARLAAQPSTSTAAAWRSGRFQRERHVFADRNPLAGACNPLSPPLRATFDGQRLRAELTFTAMYGGAPGIVHGGFVAAAFDQAFGHLVVYEGIGGLTGQLTVRYLRPTLLDIPVVFEAWLDREAGKRVFVVGESRQGGLLIGQAEATFVEIDRAVMEAMTRG